MENQKTLMARGAVRSWRILRRGLLLEVVHGRVWATVDGEDTDWLAHKGQRLVMLGMRGLLVLEALEDSEVRVGFAPRVALAS